MTKHTDTLRAVSSVSRIADAIIIAGCVRTRRVFRTSAVIIRTLVYVCEIETVIS